MAFQRVPNSAEIAHTFMQQNKITQNTYYAQFAGAYSQSDIQTLADEVDNVFALNFVTEMCSDVIYVRTDVRGLDTENDLEATQNAGTGPGTHIGDSLPNQVTFSIKKSSGLTGRSARGRTYWCGIPSNERDVANENFLESVYAAAIVNDVDFIRLTIDTIPGWSAVLVSRFANKVARVEGVTFPWATTSNVDLRLDTNRGRLPAV